MLTKVTDSSSLSVANIGQLRPDLEEIPHRMKSLPIDRGYPVPWFVAWMDSGEPEFRAMDGRKWRQAVKEKLCWVCGNPILGNFVFVAGPMCGINRTSAEPPCHLICAQWSARNCPFLSKPQMTRRENNLPPEAKDAAGFAIMRNPGVTLLWVTKTYSVFEDGMGGKLIRMGEPERVEWWALGKRATRQQVEESVAGGLPKLEELARQQVGAMEELHKKKAEFEEFYPTDF
jgi:hypothetical protein